MGDPRAKVLSLQIKNFESRNFVPYQSLKELMSRDFVRAIISTCDLPKFRQPEVVEIVMRGARRILAILLVLYKANFFLHFIDRDNFQVVNLDHKLPYTLSSLSTIFESETVAKEFFDVQWGFVAPEFTYSALHRSLDINTVLPFVDEEKQLGEGGFGTVTEVFLPPFLQKSVCVDGHEVRAFSGANFGF